MAYKQHDIFQLIWKSNYSVSKETIDVVLKELDDEIQYQSTIVLPRAIAYTKKNVLNTLASLRKQRDNLISKYDDQRFPRASGGLGGDPQDTDAEFKTEAKEKSFKKSISKRDILKALYGRAWGSTAGLNEDVLHKMSNAELDEQIRALEVLFD